jgi:hypothetical protein
MATYDPSWIITETVLVKRISYFENLERAVRVLVRSVPDGAGSYLECELRYDGENLTFNTVRVDVDDDLVSYLGLMDRADEIWRVSEPVDDEIWRVSEPVDEVES